MTFNSPSTILYDKLGWLTIEERITYITGTLVYRCLYESAPTELQSLFIIRNGRELRNTGINFTLPFQACHTTLFKKSDSFFGNFGKMCYFTLFLLFFSYHSFFTLFSAHKSKVCQKK